MTAFSYIRPGGVWADDSTLTAAECAQIDENLTKCLNAEDGGTWAPTTIIEVGGEGAEFTTWLRVTEDGQFSVGGEDIGVTPGFYVYPGQQLAVTDFEAQLRGLVYLGGGNAGTDVDKSVEVRGKMAVTAVPGDGSIAFSVDGRSRFSDYVYVDADASFSERITVTGLATFNGPVQALDTITVGGGISQIGGDQVWFGDSDGSTVLLFNSPLSFASKGRILRRNETFSAASFASYNYTTQSVVIPPTQLTSAATILLSNTSASNGDVISVANNSTTYDCTVTDGGGNTLATVWANHWGEFEFVGGAWTRVKLGSFLKHSVAD